MQEIRTVLGRKIREAREEKGVTQKELGELLGYSSMGISHFENGIRELRLSDLQKLAEFLAKPLSFFFPEATPAPTTLYRNEPSSDPEVSKSLERFEKYLDQLDERSSATH